MAGALVALMIFAATILLFGAKLAGLLGLVVACATFSFPVGLIGMVGIGVSLLILLAPRQYGSERTGTD